MINFTQQQIDEIISQYKCNTKHLYVMDRKDFFDKFVKLIEYNNGDNSKQGISETD